MVVIRVAKRIYVHVNPSNPSSDRRFSTASQEIRFRVVRDSLLGGAQRTGLRTDGDDRRETEQRTGQDKTGLRPPTDQHRTFPRAGDPVSSRRREISLPRLCIFHPRPIANNPEPKYRRTKCLFLSVPFHSSHNHLPALIR